MTTLSQDWARNKRWISPCRCPAPVKRVEVNSEAPLINPANANTSTTLNAPALENLPNPGGDLTYPLQFAAGALINTAGSGNDFVGGTNGYGNVEFNGLPALSNGYIVDGLETNDPLTNLNSGLSTNLVLGLNSISEVTVNTLSYSVDQGRYGASQVNYVTKSGTNQFHGNLYEIWNGSRSQRRGLFHERDAGKPQAALNRQSFWRQSGRPDPSRQAVLLLRQRMGAHCPADRHPRPPSRRPAFEQYVLQQLPLGGTDAVTGSTYRRRAATRAVLSENVFALRKYRRNAARRSGLSFQFGRQPRPRALRRTATAAPIARAFLIPATITNKCRPPASTTTSTQRITAWFRFQADTGLQAAYTDPINPLFNSVSPQPLYSFAAGYTHVFSQNLVNYFNPALLLVLKPVRPSRFPEDARRVSRSCCRAAAPTRRSPPSADWTIPGCREGAPRAFSSTTIWRGATAPTNFAFGTNTRIFRLNDYDFGEGTVPTVTYTDLPQFIYGVASTATKTFPLAANEPFNFLNLDLYAQDTWKLTPKSHLDLRHPRHLQFQSAESA